MRRGRAGIHAAAAHRRRRRHRHVRRRGNRARGTPGMGTHSRNNIMARIIFFTIFGFIALTIGLVLMFVISVSSGVALTSVGGAFLIMALCTYIAVRNRPVNRTVQTTATAVSTTTASGTITNVSPGFTTTQSAFATAPTAQTLQSGYGGFAPYPDSTQTNNYSHPPTYYPPPPLTGSYPSGAPPAYNDVVK